MEMGIAMSCSLINKVLLMSVFSILSISVGCQFGMDFWYAEILEKCLNFQGSYKDDKQAYWCKCQSLPLQNNRDPFILILSPCQ
jgi:hypothetical protein